MIFLRNTVLQYNFNYCYTASIGDIYLLLLIGVVTILIVIVVNYGEKS